MGRREGLRNLLNVERLPQKRLKESEKTKENFLVSYYENVYKDVTYQPRLKKSFKVLYGVAHLVSGSCIAMVLPLYPYASTVCVDEPFLSATNTGLSFATAATIKLIALVSETLPADSYMLKP